MKKEIAKYINVIFAEERPLTDVQARLIAYWEFVDFQGNVDGFDQLYCNMINKFLENSR